MLLVRVNIIDTELFVTADVLFDKEMSTIGYAYHLTAGVLYRGLPTLWSHSDALCVVDDAL